MKTLFFLCCCLYSWGLFGQIIYFNKTFKPDTTNILSPACLVVQDGYLFSGSFGSFSGNGFYIDKTDFQGETVWFKTYHQADHTIYAIGGGILVEAHGGGYLLTGSIAEPSSDTEIIMLQVDEDGDIVWEKLFEKPTTCEYMYRVTPTSDKGYIMAGSQYAFNTAQNNRAFLLKVDSLGNEEWSQQYHPNQHGKLFAIFETDTGYIASGAIKYPDTNHDMFIMEINKLGGMVWEKNYGTDESDNGALIMPIGNNLFLASAIRQNNVSKPFVALIDSVGDTLWTRTFDVPIGAMQEAPPQPTPDGGFVCLYSYDTDLGYRAPWFWRFTATGDTLWTRRIPGMPTNHNSYLKDIVPTHDGGWLLSGFDYSEQSAWAVKLDSLGYTCSYVGCDSTALIDHIDSATPSERQALIISPNPATDVLHLEAVGALSPSHELQFSLYDAMGRAVRRLALRANAGSVRLGVADLPQGLYFWTYSVGNQVVQSDKISILRP